MALTPLGSPYVGSGSNKYQVTANTTGAASVLVALPGCATGTGNITSSRGNVAVYLGTASISIYRVALYWCNSVTNPGTGDVWADPDGAISGAEIHVVCYSDGAGMTVVGSVQTGNDATFGGTTTAGGSGQVPLAAFTATQAGDSIIGSVIFGSAVPTGLTASPSGTSIDSSPGAAIYCGCTFHHDASATGSVQPVVSWTGSTRWAAIGALVRAPAGVNGTASGVTLTATASLIAGAASSGVNGTANGVTFTAAASLIPGAALGNGGATLNFQAAGEEFGKRTGLAISTFSLDVGSAYRVEVFADGLTLGSPILTTGSLTTDSAGKLPNVTNALLFAGVSYAVACTRQSDKQRVISTMVAA